MEEVFNIFDIDKNGSINGYELKIALRALGFNASNEECNNIMARYNKKKGHPFDALNQEEFFLIIGEQIALKNPEDEIREAFELFDTEDKGSITVKNLQNALVQLERGNEKTEEELQAEIARWDKDGDGQLNYEEFRAIMLNQEAI
ncbi:Cell division control protein 31 [Tritrichomonas foetus]|uniref:Cell division control protein 31 n=1 Tax=Tritrichomonas foetus TaxID=1144522 RepID=A0A1J4KP47_9EUKA|nr:Cell division control protein 31 [Tritrichomonas foetus]|eukprot:OHT11197.1 Cell division control protein 31 [Tritrichomonas foetus]